MSDYNECLIAAQLHRMGKTINDFLDGMKERLERPGARPEDQKTLVLIPGGMASELSRANSAFRPELTADQYTYDTIWFDLVKIVFGAALDLDMNGNNDKDNRFIVADGAMENCLYKPYDGFVEWCGNQDLDVLVFGWDFRRRPEWVVNFFLEHFVPAARQAALDRGLPDPFAHAVLVGHSFGGMVAKWILNDETHDFCRNLELAVSVGTPFYGTASQTLRLFKGEPQIGSAYDLRDITKVISTMPGGYALFFLDGATFDTHADQFAADPVDPLLEFPSLDIGDRGVRVDPYTIATLADGRSRYPHRARGWTWFESYLDQGRDDVRRLAQPLAPSVRHKFHNIRGVQIGGDGAPRPETRRSIRWGWAASDYDPDHSPSPISDPPGPDEMGPGDGVVPAWSARLVTQDPANIHTIEGNVEHAEMLDDPDVRGRLLQLLALGPGAPLVAAAALSVAPGSGRRRPAAASLEEYERYRDEFLRIAAAHPHATAIRKVKDKIDTIGLSKTASLMRRHYIELAKPPVVLGPGKPRLPARSP
jgi:hypothetical protein